jgi:hypothetical protein
VRVCARRVVRGAAAGRRHQAATCVMMLVRLVATDVAASVLTAAGNAAGAA